ncbi:MAG TPA: phasin family protein [Paraburkholderia sp.]|nr:phasin family protein [Paraburkholderia sp.]
MASKMETASSAAVTQPFLQLGKEQTDAVLHMQKEVMAAYEEACRAWVTRVKSELELWSDLAAKLSASRSMPDALEACRQSVAQRLQMATEDGQRVIDSGQKIVSSINRSLSHEWPPKISS